ncbi:hypothetical protein [Geodermatophilus sp. DSM 44513]|uniref:hypothetical protein n=1 Tax=Geodermatophilus sp. DSM 44513 TaxID=1528104 RepID=UPI00127F3F0F|nr:hypothetical protein [Geodermatophilus sp. DSM 44513]WNV75422.1 hypothetical protein RTG05_20980 [Geodermatophilus sp. DSM 44513]
MDPGDRDLLQELLSAHGPPGQDDAVREICRRELACAALVAEFPCRPVPGVCTAEQGG